MMDQNVRDLSTAVSTPSRPMGKGPGKRQLPTPTAARHSGMRRAQSLSFLPSSGLSDDNSMSVLGSPRRRVLPDPQQGKLIRHVEEKLREEAKARLDVAKELKEEKRMRWNLEDQLAEADAKIKEFQTEVAEKRQEIFDIAKDLQFEAKLRHNAEVELTAEKREVQRLTRIVEKERLQRASMDEDASNVEETVQEAWKVAYEERRLRQMAEEKLESILNTIRVHAESAGADNVGEIMQHLQA